MSNKKIIETELFEIYFSKDKRGRENKKFNEFEKKKIIESVKQTEDIISRILSFSRSKPISELYRVPIIFEKVTQKKFEEKHQNHYAFLQYPPIGSMWNKTVKFEGVEIRSKTAIILLCPMEKKDVFESISHEVTHAAYDSFLERDGVNHENKTYFLEGLTELTTKMTSEQYKNKKQ